MVRQVVKHCVNCGSNCVKYRQQVNRHGCLVKYYRKLCGKCAKQVTKNNKMMEEDRIKIEMSISGCVQSPSVKDRIDKYFKENY